MRTYFRIYENPPVDSKWLAQERLKEACQAFAAQSAVLLIMLLLVRLVDYLNVGVNRQIETYTISAALSGLRYDLLLFLVIGAFFGFPYLLLFFFKPSWARWFYHLGSLLLVAFSYGLVKYFSVALVPLGADLFGYRWEEVTYTIQVSNDAHFLDFLPVVLYLLGWWGLYSLLKRITWAQVVIYGQWAAMAASLFFVHHLAPAASAYGSDLERSIVANKLGLFTTKVQEYLTRKAEEDILANTPFVLNKKDRGSDENLPHYLTPEYPFLRANGNQNVLGPFFQQASAQKPNIVIIIGESLGRAYAGLNAELGSFTPFLDSLAQHGLFFENFLSMTGRTFGALPSVLGSLPFGERGFMEMEGNMPAHHTLISVLEQNGYNTAFHYGGEVKFDQMATFLQRQGIDTIYDEKSFGKSYQRLPAKGKGQSWGYGDKEVFRQDVALRNSKNFSAPHLDVFLTIASHEPFLVPDGKAYLQKFEQRLTQLGLSKKQKKALRPFAQQYSTFLYFDDALKQYIQALSTRPEYQNTIFIITGDHRMSDTPASSRIDRFRVPLLIYSPLLKRSAHIKSVSAHFDLAPSLLDLLKGNFGLNAPETVAWLGMGLDTTRTFRSIHSYPLMLTKNELVNYVSQEYYLADGDLFKLQDGLKLQPEQNEAKKQELLREFTIFKHKNYFVTKHNRLLPDSLKK